MSGQHICLAEVAWNEPESDEMTANVDFHRMSMVPSSARGMTSYNSPSTATSYAYYDDYELYMARCTESYDGLKKLRNSHYKLKVAYFVLTLFVILSIATFILMNPVVSSFIWKNSFWQKCVDCKLLDKCNDKQLRSTYQDHENLDKCCFDTFEKIVSLVTDCYKQPKRIPNTSGKQDGDSKKLTDGTA